MICNIYDFYTIWWVLIDCSQLRVELMVIFWGLEYIPNFQYIHVHNNKVIQRFWILLIYIMEFSPHKYKGTNEHYR